MRYRKTSLICHNWECQFYGELAGLAINEVCTQTYILIHFSETRVDYGGRGRGRVERFHGTIEESYQWEQPANTYVHVHMYFDHTTRSIYVIDDITLTSVSMHIAVNRTKTIQNYIESNNPQRYVRTYICLY